MPPSRPCGDAIAIRVERLIESIDYDFDRFTFSTFRRWLERNLRRNIILLPWEFPANLSGAWIPTSTADYIFFQRNLPSPRQLHIKLHECGHILCGHQPIVLADEFAWDGSKSITSFSITDRLLLRIGSHLQSETEAEAEYFAQRIMARFWKG